MFVSKNGDSRKTPKNDPTDPRGKCSGSSQQTGPRPVLRHRAATQLRLARAGDSNGQKGHTPQSWPGQTARLVGDAFPLFYQTSNIPLFVTVVIFWYDIIISFYSFIYYLSHIDMILLNFILLLFNNRCDYFDMLFPLVGHDMSSHLCMLAAWPPFLWDSQKRSSYQN